MREVQSIEVCARTDLGNSLENTTQTKSKRAIKLEKQDIECFRKGTFYIPFFESLILAQDERWRRA